MTALAIVGEDATHAALIDGLLKQTLREAALDAGIAWVVDALDAEMPIIEWLGADAVELGRHAVRYFERDKVAKQLKGQHGASMVRGRAVKTHGFIQGRPLGPSAKVWRRALIAVFSDERVEGVIAAEDTDGDPAKLDGLRQAAALFDGALVVCAPHQDAEAWLVLGLAGSPHLTAITRALGFDPTREPHRLTGSPNAAATDAKRVLRRLLFDEDRSGSLTVDELAVHRDACLPSAATIAAQGTDCGIAAFCDAIRRDIAPLFDAALSAP